VRVHRLGMELVGLCGTGVTSILTIEQIQQKDDKRRRTKECTVVENFSGSWCPITKGWRVLFHPPCSDEPRIPVFKEERLLVTRWKTYWIYGELLYSKSDSSLTSRNRKGWLPRHCAVVILNPLHNHSDSEHETLEEQTEQEQENYSQQQIEDKYDDNKKKKNN